MPPAPRRRVVWLALYFVLVLPALMFLHVGLVPDVLIFVLLGAAVVLGQARLFLRDWGVFLLVLILWQHTSKLAQWAGFPLHLGDLEAVDRAITWPLLHGALPQVWLQQHFYLAHAVGHGTYRHWVGMQWYDVLSWAVYALHFPEPLLVGLAIWLYSRGLFRRFASAFLILAALSFAVYVVYPAVPPWLAARPTWLAARGLLPFAIPHVWNIFNEFNYWVLQQGFGQGDKSLIHIDYDVTGAMPSLHAAFPVLSALYLRKAFGRWGLLMLGYALLVWFAVVYMAQHWIIDVAVGLVFACLAYTIVEAVAAWHAARVGRQSSVVEPELVTAERVASSRS